MARRDKCMWAVHAGSPNTAFSVRITYIKIVCLIENRSAHLRGKGSPRTVLLTSVFVDGSGNVRAFGDERDHNDRQGFSLLHLNLMSSSPSRLKCNHIEHLHELIHWLAPSTQDIMW